jgi:hypothetical protein
MPGIPFRLALARGIPVSSLLGEAATALPRRFLWQCSGVLMT